MKRTFIYNVGPEEEMNIRTLLKQKYKMSTALINKLKQSEDGITVNGARQKVSFQLEPGDVVKLRMREEASEQIVPTPVEFSILYEDEDLIIIDKPPYLPTHPSMGHFTNTLANGLAYYWQQKGEAYVFRAVNRLDKNTSGVMAVAKNAYIHAQLCSQIQEGQLRRKYRCIVCGAVEKDGTVDAPIGREDGSILRRQVRQDGQQARTHYRVLERKQGHTLLELELETGRTHQIRVHMAYLGYPVLGDFLYGEETEKMPRQALHSSFLTLTHPVTFEALSFEAPLPQDLQSFWDCL